MQSVREVSTVAAHDTGHRVRSDEELIRIYRESKTIAVVGASNNVAKPAHLIPRYLQEQGYRILPVNPRGGQLLGEPGYRSLSEIDTPVDVVDVFRPPAEAEAVAREAIALGATVLWFQPGTHTEEAVRLAVDAGLLVVAGRCMGAAHGELGLGPGPRRPGDSIREAQPGSTGTQAA
jgi:predicted CoA-binding protein